MAPVSAQTTAPTKGKRKQLDEVAGVENFYTSPQQATNDIRAKYANNISDEYKEIVSDIVDNSVKPVFLKVCKYVPEMLELLVQGGIPAKDSVSIIRRDLAGAKVHWRTITGALPDKLTIKDDKGNDVEVQIKNPSRQSAGRKGGKASSSRRTTAPKPHVAASAQQGEHRTMVAVEFLQSLDNVIHECIKRGVPLLQNWDASDNFTFAEIGKPVNSGGQVTTAASA